jgi:hypothetical protein
MATTSMVTTIRARARMFTAKEVLLVPVSKFSRLMFFGRENVAVTKVVRVVVIADILRKLVIVQACQLV